MADLIAIYQAREAARDRRRQIGNIVSLGALFAGVMAIPAYLTANAVLSERAERKAWTITGPACPVVEWPSPRAVSQRRPPRSHDYGGAVFARSFGAVSCAGFREARLFGESEVYHVCQFNNPGAVTVKTARGSVTFEAAPGRQLTVTVRDGQASCVVGGWFNLR